MSSGRGGRGGRGDPGAAAGGTRRDVLVVGGGPAGLSAARAALARGATVTIADAGLRLGGQILRQPLCDERGGEPPGPAFGPSLPARFRSISGHPRLEVVTGRGVWSLVRDERGVTARLEGGAALWGRALVLATGASELLLPFEGWELPGVVGAGAAQALLKSNHQLVGRRVLVAGSGPFLLPVATGLARAGARVLAVVEAQPAGRLAGLAPALARQPARLAEAARYATELARRRVPLRLGSAVVRAAGDGAVSSAVVAPLGPDWRPAGAGEELALDAVCVSFGFVPRLELARQLGVAERRSPLHPGISVAVDESGATSLPGVFAAGELTGIAGAHVAELEGSLAGDAAAAWCRLDAGGRGAAGSGAGGGTSPGDAGLTSTTSGGPAAPVATARLRRELRAARRFAADLERTYRLQPGLPWASGHTVVCRCEDVSAEQLRAAIAGGAASARELRSLTRCGMGYCQGRTCGPIVQLALGAALGVGLDEVGDLQQRPVAVPVPLGEVAIPVPDAPEAPAGAC